MSNIDKLRENLIEKINLENDNFIKEYSEYDCVENFIIMNGSGGKHIRGMLILLACLANGKQITEDVFSVAVAIEFLQTAFLIQDDVIDMENTRRGKEAVHILLQNKHKNKIFGDTAAYILGTFGVTYASRLINIQDKKIEKKVKNIFFEMIFDTIQGESFDIVFPLMDMKKSDCPIKITERIELAESIAALKTAVYSFETPLRMGNILSGGDDNEQWFHEFGKELGIAFQIRNDLEALKKIKNYETGNYMTDINPYRITTLNSTAFKENVDLFNLICDLQNKSDLELQLYYKKIKPIFEEQSDDLKDALLECIDDHYNKAINCLEKCDCPFKMKDTLREYLKGLF